MSKNIRNNVITVGKNDPTADFNTADFNTEWNTIKAAVDSVKLFKGFKKVFVKNTDDGVYNFNKGIALGLRINMDSNIEVEFDKGVTVRGTRTSDYLFYNNSNNGSNPVVNFVIKGGIFDLDNTLNGSGFGFTDTIYSGLIGCTIKNGATGGWLYKFGSESSLTSTFFGKNNFIEKCIFDTHQGSLEMGLVYNQTNYTEIDCEYKNKGTVTSGPVFGLWQNTENTKIINPRYINNNGFNYYSNSCNYTTFVNVYGENSGCLLQGANISDNTIFGPEGGIQRAIGLNVKGFTAKGGINSQTTQAIQLGAVRDYNIEIDYIDNYESGLLFHRGNNSNNAVAIKGKIQLGTIKNCNPLNNVHNLHTGVLFTKPGDYDVIINNGEVYDTRPIKFQQQPVFFEQSGVTAVITLTQTGGILNNPILVSGGTEYEPNSTGIPITINSTSGTGGVITGTSNALGVITSLTLVSAGTLYSSDVTASANSNNIYSNIRITNSKLIPYSGRDSVRKNNNVVLDSTVQFNSIRTSIKGTLAKHYDTNIVINDASITQSGLVNTVTQDFAGRKGFNSNDTFFGTGINTSSLSYANLGNQGTPDAVYLEGRSSNNPNVKVILKPKGNENVYIDNQGALKEVLLLQSNKTISALTSNNVALYTVPTGKTVILTKAFIRPTTVTGVTTTPPAISIGANATTFDDFMLTTTLTNAVALNKVYNYQPNLAVTNSYTAGQVINAQIDTVQVGATALTYTIDLFGYLL